MKLLVQAVRSPRANDCGLYMLSYKCIKISEKMKIYYCTDCKIYFFFVNVFLFTTGCCYLLYLSLKCYLTVTRFNLEDDWSALFS